MSRPLVALSAAVVAFAFQQTAVVPALPTIEADLDAPRQWTAWLVTGYLVAASVATPLLGKLGDRHGRRRVLAWSLVVFFLGSVGAALAPTIEVLIASRLLQGAGGAVFPLAIALARDADPERAASAAGLITGAFGIGVSLGFGLSGPLVELASWRWTFAVAAVAVAVAGIGLRWVPQDGERSTVAVDVPSALLLTVGLGAILLGLTEPGTLAAVGVAGLGAMVLFVRRERRSAAPLLGVGVLREPKVLAVNAAGFLLGVVMFGAFLLVPYRLQSELGAGPLQVGLYLLPSALAQIVGGPLAGPLAARTSSRAVYVTGVACAAASAVLLAAAPTSVGLVLAAMTLLGLGIGLAIGIGSALITAGVQATEAGVANAVNAVTRRVGGSIGGQLGAAVLATGGGFRAAVAVCAAAGIAGAFVAARA